MLLSKTFHVSLDVLLKDDFLLDGIKEEHSCSNNTIREKKTDIYEGVLIKESISDENIIDLLNVHKVELWNTGGNPKYWTVLFFTCAKKDFPRYISETLIANGANWFVDFKCGNEKYIVFKNKILKYQIGNQTEKDFVCNECKKMGISENQMHWSE